MSVGLTGTPVFTGQFCPAWGCNCQPGPGSLCGNTSLLPMPGATTPVLEPITVNGANNVLFHPTPARWLPLTGSVPGSTVMQVAPTTSSSSSVVSNNSPSSLMIALHAPSGLFGPFTPSNGAAVGTGAGSGVTAQAAFNSPVIFLVAGAVILFMLVK